MTLDGPSGTGKSTVSRLVAQRLGLPHLDTGAFYRAATLAALRAKVDVGDPLAVARVVDTSDLSLVGGTMLLNGEDVSGLIRSPEVTAAVSAVAAHPEVRNILVGLQRQWVGSHDSRAVVEGRDIGSVVFPDASHKIYLDARPEVRAARRALQDGQDMTRVLQDQAKRDHLDSTRPSSPLTVPAGARVVDTSDLRIDEVVTLIVSMIAAH